MAESVAAVRHSAEGAEIVAGLRESRASTLFRRLLAVTE